MKTYRSRQRLSTDMSEGRCRLSSGYTQAIKGHCRLVVPKRPNSVEKLEEADHRPGFDSRRSPAVGAAETSMRPHNILSSSTFCHRINIGGTTQAEALKIGVKAHEVLEAGTKSGICMVDLLG